MKKQEINPVPLIPNAEAALATEEGKVPAQLQQETLQVADQRLFQIVFGILIFEPEELQHKRVFDLLLGGGGVLSSALGATCQHGGLVSREGSPLVKLSVYLAM